MILLFEENKRKKAVKQQHILKIKKGKKKGGGFMNEIIKKFTGKECIITTINESVTGLIESVEDNWITVSQIGNSSGGTEIINVDYISRIREYPKNKNGKKKPVVF